MISTLAYIWYFEVWPKLVSTVPHATLLPQIAVTN